MTVSERLIDAAAPIWAGYHTHPFVRGIADGSLDTEKFRYYMVQDYLYLIDYAKVFAIGAAKAKDMDTMAYMAAFVDQILHGEMEIHRAYMKRLGITEQEAESARPALANVSYTSYMLRVAYEDGAAEVAASILACAVSYEQIAQRIVKDHPEAAQHPFFGEWVRGYADPAYHEGNVQLMAMTDRLAEGMSEAELVHLTEIFVNCSRYETGFWDMGWRMEQ